MKNHQCNRCRRHVSKTFEVIKKTGSRQTFCEGCIETMQNKGAVIELHPTARIRRQERIRRASGRR